MTFFDRIRKMNADFAIGCPSELTDLGTERVQQFMAIFIEECVEGLKEGCDFDMVRWADFLGDVQVYAASEMVRWGISPEGVLDAIMDSQDSKLVDGKAVICPITGKFLKGPDYRPPEDAIAKVLEQ